MKPGTSIVDIRTGEDGTYLSRSGRAGCQVYIDGERKYRAIDGVIASERLSELIIKIGISREQALEALRE